MIKVKLTKVQETLLLPLIARAEVSKWKDPELLDEKAVQLSDSLDYDKTHIKKIIEEAGLLGLAIRAKKFDAAIRHFLEKHPNGKVLNIGAGLDTSFYRVDNGTLQWYDLDLPDSMELRQKLLPPPERVTYIAKSMLDYSWIDDIGDISNGLFIQIPGVLPYFPEEMVKEFLSTIAPRLTGAEIIFDVCSKFGRLVIGQRIKKAGMSEAPLLWGISNASKIEKWSPSIKVVKVEPFFKGIKKRWFTYSPRTSYALGANDRYKITQMFQLGFV